MTLPVMEPDLDANLLKRWARLVDEGPFSSLCWGERIAFNNPDSLTLLGALSAWTERVPLVTTVVVPQLHDPVMLAKALATADMLSGGRLTVGIGSGGREEDYRAVGADPKTQTIRDMADRVAVMKRVWAGEKITESVLPVGPAPVQPGGPRLLIGATGPKSTRMAAEWADGLAGITLDLDTGRQNELFDVARAAWAEAGKPKPHLATSFWFALGEADAARAQVHRHLRHYMNWIPPEFVDAMAPTTGWSGSAEELVATLRKFAAIGTSEVHLIPTSSDLDQVRRVADLVGDID
ncbi:MAG TPA: LLM class flavin-dependent oxidoreductase [Mycobacterium sp.]|nr:LLM class flavin-dependent oxidoreductase [Mycobacterium sp.]HNM12786.1 LLM class flavin-dependent oxidoreductase [Mycobacterium sp.]HNM94940.1 LLM class flavin-dependent oxidoreductase [Mycobacterium sp.]HNP14267.1 LLM class flavin-dependent oxidoreductase [Mycobacterium sp.]